MPARVVLKELRSRLQGSGCEQAGQSAGCGRDQEDRVPYLVTVGLGLRSRRQASRAAWRRALRGPRLCDSSRPAPFYARRRPWRGGLGSGRHVRSQAHCAKDPGRPRTWEVGAQRPALSSAPGPSGQAPGRPGTGPALAQTSSGPYLPESGLRHGPEHARGGSLQEQHLPSCLGAEPQTRPPGAQRTHRPPMLSSAPGGLGGTHRDR